MTQIIKIMLCLKMKISGIDIRDFVLNSDLGQKEENYEKKGYVQSALLMLFRLYYHKERNKYA